MGADRRGFSSRNPAVADRRYRMNGILPRSRMINPDFEGAGGDEGQISGSSTFITGKSTVVAERRGDNSPAIYGWVLASNKMEKSREGRQNGSFVPDGTLEIYISLVPAMNGRAILNGARVVSKSALRITNQRLPTAKYSFLNQSSNGSNYAVMPRP